MIFTFRLVLTGTPIQLPNISPQFREVQFSAPSSNSGSIYFSDIPTNTGVESARFALAKSTSFPFKIVRLDELFVNGTSADVLDMICSVKATKVEAKKTEGGDNEPSKSS